MKELNRKYRGKNRPTDVLSFSRLEGGPPAGPVVDVGDIVLCPSVIRIQAREFGVPYHEELARMLIHGVLHIFGFDHERSKAEATRMLRLQETLLKRVPRARS